MSNSKLQRTLTPFTIWALGVGYVISGMYFGWNLGLEKGGTLGMGIATVAIMLMYICLTFSYAELACAIPKAGGVFDYADKAFGKGLAFVAGVAQSVEFIFAPPAIAFAIGAYFNSFFPQVPIIVTSVIAYLLFTGLNILGIRAAAVFETFITILAIGELLLFVGITIPSFHWVNLTNESFPNHFNGILAALPFAIWFFLGIEGIANIAEEAKHPQRDIKKGFGWTIFTLAVLCILVFVSATGVNGWRSIVYVNGSGEQTSDSPLPLALAHITGSNHLMYHLLITVGLFGLVASFHGLILAAGRSTYEFGKVRNIPAIFGKISARFHTPVWALIGNTIIGLLALLTGHTDEIITLSVFGALTIYIIAMMALMRLRKRQPDMERPYKVPFYPAFPVTVVVIGIISLASMFIYNVLVGCIYIGILLLSYILFKLFKK